MDLNLLSNRKLGRPPAKPGDPKEVAKAIQFFKERGITALAIAKMLDVSVTISYRWWKTGVMPDYRLEILQELVGQLMDWEIVNNKIFNPIKDTF